MSELFTPIERINFLKCLEIKKFTYKLLDENLDIIPQIENYFINFTIDGHISSIITESARIEGFHLRDPLPYRDLEFLMIYGQNTGSNKYIRTSISNSNGGNILECDENRRCLCELNTGDVIDLEDQRFISLLPASGASETTWPSEAGGASQTRGAYQAGGASQTAEIAPGPSF